MAVRVTGAGEFPDTFTYDSADNFALDGDDHLRVGNGSDVVAAFHRNHWAKVEIITLEES